MSNKKRNIGLFATYLFFILNTVLTIFISAFIVRTVGQTNYGVYQSMTAFLSYLVLLEFGTGTLMARNLSLLKKDGSDKQEVDTNISTIWSMTLILSLAILAFSIIFYFSLDYVFANSLTSEEMALGKTIFAFAAANTIFSFLTTTLNGLLLAYERYIFAKTVSIIKLIVRTLLLLTILPFNPSVIVVVAVDLFLTLAIFVFTLLFCIINLKAHFSIRKFDKAVFKQCLPLAFAMLLQTIINTANGSVDKFCISVMLSPDDVAIYSVSMTIFTMFSSVATLPITIFLPTIAQKMKAGITNQELSVELIEPCRVNTIITGAIMIGFIVVGRQFLELVYGVEYIASWIYAIIVIVPSFFNMTNGILVNVLNILNKRHIRSLILMITTLLNVVLTIFGIKLYGMIAAPIATAISMLGQIVFQNIYYQKAIGISIPTIFRGAYKGILPSFVIGGVVAFAVSCFIKDIGIVFQFLIVGFVFVIASGALILLFGLNTFEKTKLNAILKKGRVRE